MEFGNNNVFCFVKNNLNIMESRINDVKNLFPDNPSTKLQRAPFRVPFTHHHPIISYHGRSWLGVGKVLVGGYQLVEWYGVKC